MSSCARGGRRERRLQGYELKAEGVQRSRVLWLVRVLWLGEMPTPAISFAFSRATYCTLDRSDRPLIQPDSQRRPVVPRSPADCCEASDRPNSSSSTDVRLLQALPSAVVLAWSQCGGRVRSCAGRVRAVCGSSAVHTVAIAAFYCTAVRTMASTCRLRASLVKPCSGPLIPPPVPTCASTAPRVVHYIPLS